MTGLMQRLERLGAGLRGLRGWRRLLFAFVCGAVSAAAFAPFNCFAALLLAYAALVLLLDGADTESHPIRRAAGIGWAFLFGQFLTGMHWIGYAFLVDPGSHLWQMPFALLGLTAGLALYGALACGMAMWFWQDGPARLFVLAVMLAACEWLRGHLLTGFPWNLPAYGWGASLAVLQSASLMGAYGLSFLTILLGVSLAEIACRRWRTPLAMLLLFGALWSWGAYRMQSTPVDAAANVNLRLVQPDIPQREKYVRTLMLRNWQRLIDLSARAPKGGQPAPGIIVWPEAATGFPVALSPVALDEIGLFTERGRTVIAGSERVERGGAVPAFYNSLYVFGPNAALPLTYDKFHLVPFGEYLPFAQLLGSIGFSKLTQGATGFSSGDHPHLLRVFGAPDVSPLICYEIIFPHEVTDPAVSRPGWIVNITDDSWFGPWAGPRQHLLIAQVRAIEDGLPIARAANTGISAVIGPTGVLTASLALNTMGVVDTALPRALAPTLYAIHGDAVFLLLLVVGAIAAFILARK